MECKDATEAVFGANHQMTLLNVTIQLLLQLNQAGSQPPESTVNIKILLLKH